MVSPYLSRWIFEKEVPNCCWQVLKKKEAKFLTFCDHKTFQKFLKVFLIRKSLHRIKSKFKINLPHAKVAVDFLVSELNWVEYFFDILMIGLKIYFQWILVELLKVYPKYFDSNIFHLFSMQPLIVWTNFKVPGSAVHSLKNK